MPVPVTYFIKNTKDVSGISLNFPLVIKPFRSRIPFNGKWIGTSVKYVNSLAELEATISKTEYLSGFPFLIQEYIKR